MVYLYKYFNVFRDKIILENDVYDQKKKTFAELQKDYGKFGDDCMSLAKIKSNSEIVTLEDEIIKREKSIERIDIYLESITEVLLEDYQNRVIKQFKQFKALKNISDSDIYNDIYCKSSFILKTYIQLLDKLGYPEKYPIGLMTHNKFILDSKKKRLNKYVNTLMIRILANKKRTGLSKSFTGIPNLVI